MILSLILSTVGSILYRVGGSDLPLSNKTKYRDFGTPLCGCAILWLNTDLSPKIILGIVLTWVLSFLSMTTYFKKKGTNAMWWNWLIVGLAFSLSLLPYAWATGLWIPFIYRTIALTLGITLWSEFIGNAVVEELGRGFLFCITMLLVA